MFSLSFRDQIAGVSRALVDELDQAAASSQARWYAEHNSEGEHTRVTATKLSAPEWRLSAPLLRYEVSPSLAAGSDAAPIAVTLPAHTAFVEFFVDPTAPDAAHIKEVIVPGAQLGDFLWVVVSGTAFLHDSARRQTGAAPVAYTERIGNRLSLCQATTTTYTLGADNFRALDPTAVRILTLLRVDKYDYDASAAEFTTHPCWVQVS